jgi:EmrB/QacA subfamily drug resistance transporter
MQAVLEKDPPVAYRWRWVALFVILSVEVMDLLDSLVTTIAGPVIRDELGGSLSLIQWLGATYTLTMAIGLLTGGRLGDIFGRRRMFLIGAAGFTAASLLCALAWSPGVLIGARAIQGLFGAIMLPQGLGMIKQMFSPSEQAKAFGAFGPVMGLSAVGGPVLAGWLVDADYFGSGWRMIFFINLPLGLFAVIGAVKFLPEFRSERIPRLDLFGVLLAAAGAFLLLYPLVQGRELDWPVWVFVMLALGIVVFGLFGVVEARRERNGLDPLVTPSLFRKRAFTGGLALGLVFFSALIGTGLVFTLYLQIGLGFSPLKAGLTTLPQALGTVAGFVAAGSGLSERLGRKLLLIGTAIMMVGTIGTAVTVQWAGPGISPYQLIPALVLLGAGMGLAMAPFFNIVLAGVDDEETRFGVRGAHLCAAVGRGVRHRRTRDDFLRAGARCGRPSRRHLGGRAADAAHGRRRPRRPAAGHRVRDPHVPERPGRGEGPRHAAGELPDRRLRGGRPGDRPVCPGPGARGLQRHHGTDAGRRVPAVADRVRGVIPVASAGPSGGRRSLSDGVVAALPGSGHQRRRHDPRTAVDGQHARQMGAAPVEVVGRGVAQIDDERLDDRANDQVEPEDPENHESDAFHALDARFRAAPANPSQPPESYRANPVAFGRSTLIRPCPAGGDSARCSEQRVWGRVQIGPRVGSPAACHAAKPPARSVARNRPRSCSDAAARLLV